ncbi:MAG: M23 family metallopeptidase [Cyanobacteria bacterium J06627_8]
MVLANSPMQHSFLTRCAIALCSVLGATSAGIAQALDVQLSPTDPQLGDTVSVVIQSDTTNPDNLSVVANQRRYPVFSTGNQTYRALLPTTPLDSPGQVTVQVSDDDETRNLAIWLRDRSFPTQRITLRGGGSSLTEIERSRVQAFKQIVSPERFWNGAFLRPTSGRVSTIFGVQRYYNGVFAENYYHRGVDYATSTGTPVVAPAAGRIELIGYESQGFRVHGNTVGMDHGQGVLSIFIHLSRIDVQEGDFVQAGQTIGAVGSTGSSTGPHLHWGLYVNGQAVDPVPWRFEGID